LRRPRSTKWPAYFLCCVLGAITVNMLYRHTLPTLLLAGTTCSLAVSTNRADGNQWQWSGPHQDAGYWYDEFQGTLSIMQTTYWNGTYWPTTIQWIGAFLDTLLAASDRSFTGALEEYNGNVPGAHTSASAIHSEIHKYFTEIEAFYDDEDVIQIFGAAYDDA